MITFPTESTLTELSEADSVLVDVVEFVELDEDSSGTRAGGVSFFFLSPVF